MPYNLHYKHIPYSLYYKRTLQTALTPQQVFYKTYYITLHLLSQARQAKVTTEEVTDTEVTRLQVTKGTTITTGIHPTDTPAVQKTLL